MRRWACFCGGKAKKSDLLAAFSLFRSEREIFAQEGVAEQEGVANAHLNELIASPSSKSSEGALSLSKSLLAKILSAVIASKALASRCGAHFEE